MNFKVLCQLCQDFCIVHTSAFIIIIITVSFTVLVRVPFLTGTVLDLAVIKSPIVNSYLTQ